MSDDHVQPVIVYTSVGGQPVSLDYLESSLVDTFHGIYDELAQHLGEQVNTSCTLLLTTG